MTEPDKLGGVPPSEPDDEPRHDQTTDDEALGPQEKADAVNPNVGEGTPATAPERPVPESLLEKTRRLLRRQ